MEPGERWYPDEDFWREGEDAAGGQRSRETVLGTNKMPTTNDRISLLNDTEDVTAVKAPPPGLIRESKAMPAAGPFPLGAADDDGPPTPAPVIAPAKAAAAPRSPSIGKRAKPASPLPSASASPKPLAARPLDAKTAAANAATTMAAVASTSGPAAKPRNTGRTLAPPPLARASSILTPASPSTKPEILGPTPSAGLPALGSGALPFMRPMALPASMVAPKPRAEVVGATPSAGLPALGSSALPLLRPTTTALSTAIPRERNRPPTPAAGSAREILDLVPVSSSGPLLAPKPGAWSTRSTGGERSRLALYGSAAAVVVAAIVGIGWKQWWSARPGRIEISTTPAGAIVVLGGDPAAHRAPVAFEKAPGRYTLSVTRDGFQRDDRTIDLHPGQEVVLSIALAAAPVEAKPIAVVPEPTSGRYARRGAPAAPGAARTSMARSMARLDATFAARASARATALANAMRSDEADPPVMAATIGAPGATPSLETTTPPPADSPAAAVPASATAPAPAAKAAPAERSPQSDEVAGARTISGRLAKALLAIDSNADEYRVKAPPSLARAEMKLSAVVKMCVSAEGRVADVKLLKSADPAIDAQIPAVLGKWRYKPLVTDGRPVPFCYVLQYEIASP